MSEADEELETLYMDIYDNGFVNNDYKEKFKHYVNTITRQLEKQIEKMSKEETDIQKEIEKYFTEITGFGRDKIRNFIDIVNKALKQKRERIAELEKENAELVAKNKWYSEQVCNKECSEVWGQVEKLQKENAELKNIKDIADLIRLNNSSVVAMCCLNNKNTSLHQKLAQAKELLKEWAYNYGHVNELLEQKSLSFINKE